MGKGSKKEERVAANYDKKKPQADDREETSNPLHRDQTGKSTRKQTKRVNKKIHIKNLMEITGHRKANTHKFGGKGKRNGYS